MILGIELRVPHILNKYFVRELYLGPPVCLSIQN